MLVNARDAKHVPGRKTDVNDAQWLRQLHEYGLLRASFRPDPTCAESGAWRRQINILGEKSLLLGAQALEMPEARPVLK